MFRRFLVRKATGASNCCSNSGVPSLPDPVTDWGLLARAPDFYR